MNLDHNEIVRILHVVTHAILFLQMMNWTLLTRHEDGALKIVLFLWAALTLLLAIVTWKYYWLFSYAVLHVLWQAVIIIHIFLIKKYVKARNCDDCPRLKVK